MTNMLPVRMNRVHVGELAVSKGEVSFEYDYNWLSNPDAIPLSQSLPLQQDTFGHREALPYFAGLLPEGHLRDVLAKKLHISPRNEFQMLNRIGAECAGAVSLGDQAPMQDGIRELNEKELREILETLPQRPLHSGIDGVRLSLAGAQDKLAVRCLENHTALTLDGSPSTNILKPPIPGYDDTVGNEAFCMMLAKMQGLRPAEVSIGNASGLEYLNVVRFDRVIDCERVERVHQEDFCQAYGIMPEFKYQNEGGPSIPDLFAMLRGAVRPSAPHALRLWDMVIFNALVGNHDAHSKNFAILYHSRKATTLAPMYDCLSTAVYPELTPKMAMKIGSKYGFEEVYGQHWIALAEACGLNPAQARKSIVEMAESLPRLAEQTAKQFARRPIVSEIVGLIRKRCQLTLDRMTR